MDLGIKALIAQYLFPDLLQELADSKATIERHVNQINAYENQRKALVARNEELERKINSFTFQEKQVKNTNDERVNALIDTRFELIWKRVEEYILARYTGTIDRFDYIIRSMIDSPKSVRESTHRTFNDILAQTKFNIPMHAQQAELAGYLDSYSLNHVIKIRIPPEVFSVVIDTHLLDDMRRDYVNKTNNTVV